MTFCHKILVLKCALSFSPHRIQSLVMGVLSGSIGTVVVFQAMGCTIDSGNIDTASNECSTVHNASKKVQLCFLLDNTKDSLHEY